LQTTLDGDVPTRTRTTPDSPVEAPAPAGLSAKEREVLSAMRDAMVRLADQNSELLSQNEMLRDRVSRLEDERSTSQAAWQSAERDRVYWTLPVLDDPSAPEAATRAADWLELVRPLMADLSQGSASWWQRVEWEARSLYAKWTAMSAINRGLLIPTMSSQLADIRFQRLESRAFSMLQAALPKAVKDELLATRTLTTVSAIFVTLKLYAPGGLAERNELLDSLTSLGVAKTAQDAVAQIRRWIMQSEWEMIAVSGANENNKTKLSKLDAEVLEEAQKLLKSLRIASMSVRDGRDYWTEVQLMHLEPLALKNGIMDVAVVNLDVLYGGNVLDERVYAAAAALCGTGKVDAVIGGPPCCANSILRERGSGSWPDGSDGGPRPVRGRSGLLRFGLPSNTEEEQKKVDEHTILIFRFVTLHRIADRFNPNGSLCALENPDDPMNYLPAHRKHDEIPSVWAWPELLGILSPCNGPPNSESREITQTADPVESLDREFQTQWYLARFDQGILGHVIRKPSAALTNSWYLYQELHELRGSGYGGALTTTPQDLGERIKTSGYWAKWAPGLCSAVGRAIGKWIESTKSQREEEQREGRMMLRALTQREREFRRQKHHGSNTFCLAMDLVGFLIASLTVPLPGVWRDKTIMIDLLAITLMRVMDLRGSAQKKKERGKRFAVGCVTLLEPQMGETLVVTAGRGKG
ncbi:TY5A, partial [Symbiodinium pilosum]